MAKKKYEFAQLSCVCGCSLEGIVPEKIKPRTSVPGRPMDWLTDIESDFVAPCPECHCPILVVEEHKKAEASEPEPEPGTEPEEE